MRGSMGKNLWSSIAEKDIYKVARALVRPESQELPAYPQDWMSEAESHLKRATQQLTLKS